MKNFRLLVLSETERVTHAYIASTRDFKQITTATSTTAVVDAESWGEYDTVARQIDFKVSCLFASAVCKTQEDVIIGKPPASIDYE